MEGHDPVMPPKSDKLFHKLSQTQWQWINSTLAASTADWLIVCGHYPVWSIAEHGPTPSLVQMLKPMLEANKVAFYLNGHDHNVSAARRTRHRCHPSLTAQPRVPVSCNT